MRGVIASLIGMLGNGATHIAVATDHVIESFRNSLWPGYKTGRESSRQDFLAQVAAGGSGRGAGDGGVALWWSLRPMTPSPPRLQPLPPLRPESRTG